SQMVRQHALEHLALDARRIHVLHAAVDSRRFDDAQRLISRRSVRAAWGVPVDESVGLFVAMNYRLKGLDPLLRAVSLLPRESRFRLVVIGHPKYAAYER